MKTIVSPTDFSEISKNAANYAADMALVLGTSLSLVHVCALPIATADGTVPSYPFEQLLSDAEKNMADLKDHLFERTRGMINIYTEVREGFIINEIQEYCTKVNPYAIVMGTESASFFERLMEGATTFSALTQFAWPVIIIPPGVVFSGIRKICLACDLNNIKDTVPIKELKNFVREFRSEFHVIHVDEDGGSFTPDELSESAFLEELIGELHPIYHFKDGTEIEKTICEFAAKNDFDMLLIFPKKHSFINKIFQHSHSKSIVLQTRIPVLAIHE